MASPASAGPSGDVELGEEPTPGGVGRHPVPPRDASPASSKSSSASSLPAQPSSSQDLESQRHLLSIPITITPTNKSQASFTDILGEEWNGNLDDLPPEIASADISIAADLSFVETSSAQAAQELKKLYNQHAGISQTAPLPYIITAFTNQHGKQMFRVGTRDAPAPAASAIDPELGLPREPIQSRSHHTKRRSGISVHALLHPNVFKGGSVPPSKQPANHEEARSPQRKKLRKARSISDMHGGSDREPSGVRTPDSILHNGRAHAHTVTGADRPQISHIGLIDHVNPQQVDIFSEIMHWHATPPSPLNSSSNSFSSGPQSPDSYGHLLQASDLLTVIVNPFGDGVSFEGPSLSPGLYSSPHPVLRVMHSFESGLTARADPGPRLRTKRSANISDGDDLLSMSPSDPAESPSAPSTETNMHSRYATDVFDVLQTYRGLPLVDKLPSVSNEATIKLSLSADDTAAPKDDPRFVIWGEMEVEHQDTSISHDSFTDISSGASGISRKKSQRGKSSTPSLSDAASIHGSTHEAPQRILVAATIERWIAQLTSELNYDELLIFFLTYRTYIGAIDLCHLLICRFHWALGQATSAHDDTVRRIVRLRTFVAIRYWLLTFFGIDFVPNRSLRLLFANWLNTLRRDPILDKHPDAPNIIRKLRKVVKDCKDAFDRKLKSPAHRPSKDSKSKPSATGQPDLGHFSDGKFSRTPQQTHLAAQEDSDVDLDFIADETPTTGSRHGFPSFGSEVNGPQAERAEGATKPLSPRGNVPARSVVLAPASATMMQQPLHAMILQHRNPTTSQFEFPNVQTPAALPVHHGILSRAFVKTIGRLGRWKTVLNSRTAVQAPLGPCADVSAFDLEPNATGDLLSVPGGVQQYLRMIDSHGQAPAAILSPVVPPRRSSSVYPPGLKSSSETDGSESTPTGLADTSVVETEDVLPQYDAPPEDIDVIPDIGPLHDAAGVILHTPAALSDEAGVVPDLEGEAVPSDVDIDPDAAMSVIHSREVTLDDTDRPISHVSYSTDSSSLLGSPPLRPTNPATPQPPRQPWQLDVVSIDDLDLSDTSSDDHAYPHPPPGLKKLTRKLPLRRDFEFVRPSVDSVSSMGIRSHDSVASEQSSEISIASGGPGFGGVLEQWQVNALVDIQSDDDEQGDVEAALRRLEGQINPERQRAKAAKVDGWVRGMQERMAHGDYGDDQPRVFSDDEDDQVASTENVAESHEDSSSEYKQANDPEADVTISLPPAIPESSTDTPKTAHLTGEQHQEARADDLTPTPNQLTHHFPAPSQSMSPEFRHLTEPPNTPSKSKGRKSLSRPSTSGSMTTKQSGFGSAAAFSFPPQFMSASNPIPSYHRSFVLLYRSQTLAQHFSMIDRELFVNIKLDEFEDWEDTSQEANVLDWNQFIKDRAQARIESGENSRKMSGVLAVRARINLIANFTFSEILLTHPTGRPQVAGKLIRIAWKAYQMNNFSTLVAIIAGLRSEWVRKAMKRSWSRVGRWELRMFEDLTAFTTSAGDFKHIRKMIAILAEANSQDASGSGPDSSSAAPRAKNTSDGKPMQPTTCIPFLGLYISELQRHWKLPDLIDPTTPNEAVGIDPVTGNFNAPAHPEVFHTLAPLPPSMQLEPLINVHKQRLIAGVYKSLVAGQHLANRVHYDIDKKVYHRCLKLRGLDLDTLTRVSSLYSNTY